MAIRRDISDLPSSTVGWPADTQIRFAHLLALEWQKEDLAKGSRPHAIEGTRFRHSDAGGCARKISYRAAQIEPTDPMDLCGTWNTRLGTLIHDAWQWALQQAYPNAQVEVTSQAFPDGSGSMDALVRRHIGPTADDWVLTSVELKSMGGYPFKSAIGKAQRGKPPEGPKFDHIVQGSLNALAHEADELVLAYLGKETLSKAYSEPDVQKFCAEWTLPRERYEPIARAEIARIEGILDLFYADPSELAARKVPGSPGEIVDPRASRWEKWTDERVTDTGTIWNGQYCLYCPYLTLCSETPSGRVDTDKVRALRAALDE